ncbi:MAG TPA: OsmC family protein [Gaiella sp.]|jgi:organic hydroperoxide reductase OsmC/OhrA|nr:OsmC family protein [Gaiella sp.]
MSARARTFDYAVDVDEAWAARSERGGTTIPADEEHWAPEHLVLAGLARCSLTSLRYHCTRAGVGLSSRASVRGSVTRRDDGRFAFVEITVEADVAFEPKPDDATVSDLLMKGERDCFVGASLTAPPKYDWRVA